jgi:hypothetical protein
MLDPHSRRGKHTQKLMQQITEARRNCLAWYLGEKNLTPNTPLITSSPTPLELAPCTPSTGIIRLPSKHRKTKKSELTRKSKRNKHKSPVLQSETSLHISVSNISKPSPKPALIKKCPNRIGVPRISPKQLPHTTIKVKRSTKIFTST